MKRVLLGLVAASALLAGCATDTGPVCRAPLAHEMEAFRAIISHNENALGAMLAPGTVRNSFISRDPALRGHVWGSQGETRGTVVGLLSQPPLCIIDDPAVPATDASRQIYVYPQRAFTANGPSETVPASQLTFPYGVIRRDYMRCRFEQTATGWKLADMCGYRASTPAVTG